MLEVFPKTLFSVHGIGGVDFGSSGKVLVRKGDVALVWFSGYSIMSCGVKGFGRDYVPARLVIQGTARNNFSRVSQTLHEGGRLSSKILDRVKKDIDLFFGEGTTDRISLRTTIVLPSKDEREVDR